MKMIGHKTESVYRRYAIVDEAMLRDAAVKRAARRGQSPGQSGLVIIEPVSGKDVKKLVGRNGIEPPTPGFSDLSLGNRQGSDVRRSLSAPECSGMTLNALTGTKFGHNRNSDSALIASEAERVAPFYDPTITEEMVADISRLARNINFGARDFIADAVMSSAV
jgi:hypothetical protein